MPVTRLNRRFSISGSSSTAPDSLIGYVTIENAEATTKTNEIFETGLPTAATHVATGQVLKIKDDDGAGGIGSTLALAQVDLVHTDGHSKQRFAKFTGIIPSLLSSSGGAMKRRRLAIYSSSDALPTGSAITIANVQAVSGYSNGLYDVSCDVSGTVFSVSVKDILDAGTTTYTKTALWTCSQTIRSGPLCTEWRLRSPLRNAGTAHVSGDGLHAEFHLSAYKAGASDVSAANPITATKCDVLVENGDHVRAMADAVHYYYGLEIRRATSLTDPTMISTDQTCYPYGAQRFAYARSSPAVTLTLSGTGINALNFDAQTSAFSNGFTLTGSTSSARATISSFRDHGTDGWILLGSAVGTFLDNETIRDDNIGTAVVNGVMTQAGNSLTMTRASGVWDQDIVGAHICANGGVGRAVVTARVSDTVVTVYVYEPFLSSSLASGGWTIEGIGHHYNARYFRRAWIGNRPTHVTALGDHASAVNTSARAVADFIGDSEAILEPALAYGDVSHTTGAGKINLMRGDAGTIRPLTILGDQDVEMGEISPYYPASGPRPQIGPQPNYVVDALVRYDETGRRRLFENSAYVSTNTYYLPPRLSGTPANGNLPLAARADQGGSNYYFWHDASFGTQPSDINRPASRHFWPISNDHTHHPAGPLAPYLLTGDYVWLRWLMENEAFYGWACHGVNAGGGYPTGYGSGSVATRGPLGATDSNSEFGNSHTRGMAWTFREMLDMTSVVPDASKDQLWHPKSYYLGRLAQRSASAVHWINTPRLLSPTTGPVWDFREGGDNNYATLHTGSAGAQLNIELLTPWTFAFLTGQVSRVWYLGLEDSDFETYIDWMMRHYTDAFTDSNVVWEAYLPTFQHVAKMNDAVNSITSVSAGDPTSVAEMYHRTCMAGPSNVSGWGIVRTPTGTLTLSSTAVGTGRTFTFSNSYFAGGGTGSSAWYAGNGSSWLGGYIRDTVGGGLAKITSVTSGTVVVATIITAFSTTTPTIGNIRIPGPHPSDDTGSFDALDASRSGYGNHALSALKALQKPRPAETDAIITAYEARANFDPVGVEPQFYIVEHT